MTHPTVVSEFGSTLPSIEERREAGRQLRAEGARLRVALLESELELGCTITNFADSATASGKLLQTAHRIALGVFTKAQNTISKQDLSGSLPDSVRAKLGQLRAALAIAPTEGQNQQDASPSTSTASIDVVAVEKEIREDGHHDALTRRELEVLTRIAEGFSTKQIAGMLGIAFRTATCHRSRLMEKLAIHDTATLVRYAIRNGIAKP